MIGKYYRAPDHFLVGRAGIREFAAAVKDDHSDPLQRLMPQRRLPRAGSPADLWRSPAGACMLEIFTVQYPDQHRSVFHRTRSLRFPPVDPGQRQAVLTPILTQYRIPRHGARREIRSEVTDAAESLWSPVSSPCCRSGPPRSRCRCNGGGDCIDLVGKVVRS